MLTHGVNPRQVTVAETAAWLTRLQEQADDDGHSLDGIRN